MTPVADVVILACCLFLAFFSQHCLFSVAVFLALRMDFMAEARGGSLICGTGEDHGSPRLSSTTGLRGLSAQLENRQVPSAPCTTCGHRVVDALPSQCHGGGWGWGGEGEGGREVCGEEEEREVEGERRWGVCVGGCVRGCGCVGVWGGGVGGGGLVGERGREGGGEERCLWEEGGGKMKWWGGVLVVVGRLEGCVWEGGEV